MKTKAYKFWTTGEDKYLMDNNGKLTASMASEHLGRSISSVSQRASFLGVKFVHKNRLYLYAYYENDALVMMSTIEDISKQTGLSIRELYRYQYPSVKKTMPRELVKIEDDELYGS